MGREENGTSTEPAEVPELRIKKGKDHLECKLTPQEVHESGKALAEALRQRSEIEKRAESFKQQLKADVSTVDGQIQKFQSLVATETEFRMVDVEIVLD